MDDGKRVLDHFAVRFAVLTDHDLHDVEAVKKIRMMQQAQPGFRSLQDEPSFVGIDRIGGATVRHAGARLHLGKHQGVPVAADQIDLAAFLCPEAAVKNLVTGAAQETRGDLLAA